MIPLILSKIFFLKEIHSQEMFEFQNWLYLHWETADELTLNLWFSYAKLTCNIFDISCNTYIVHLFRLLAEQFPVRNVFSTKGNKLCNKPKITFTRMSWRNIYFALCCEIRRDHLCTKRACMMIPVKSLSGHCHRYLPSISNCSRMKKPTNNFEYCIVCE